LSDLWVWFALKRLGAGYLAKP